MILNEKQSYGLKKTQEGRNIFVTGPGGVGKSVLIHKIKELYEHETIFLSPTGVAAQNIGGSTIHSTFHFGFGYLSPDQRKRVSDKCRSVFEGDTIKRVVIDEISMTRADLLSAIDMNLRVIKRRNIPFGGIQVIIVGDFYQLMPILNERSSEGYNFLQEFQSPFCFHTKTWKEMGAETINMDQIMRQSDESMINALNSIRKRDENFEASLDFLNGVGINNMKNVDESVDPLFLCTFNKDAETINRDRYEEIPGEEVTFIGKQHGKFKDHPVPSEINIKEGCKVLICANNNTLGYFNGQTGVVREISQTDGFVMVELSNGEVKRVVPNKWEEFEYVVENGVLSKKVVGSYVQMPLKLGWAVSIHKSQGMSLTEAVIYTGRGCFTHGQAYVALSRLRSLEGLYLVDKIYPNEVIVDKRVHDFYNGKVSTNLMDF